MLAMFSKVSTMLGLQIAAVVFCVQKKGGSHTCVTSNSDSHCVTSKMHVA